MNACRLLALGVIVVMFSTACAAAVPAGPTVTPTADRSAGGGVTAVPPAGQPMAGMFRPLDPETCRALAGKLSTAVNAEFAPAEADFVDLATNQGGRGCQSTAVLAASQNTIGELFSALKNVLVADGWARAVEYRPDGAAGMAAVFIKGGNICQLSVAGVEISEACDGKTSAECTSPAEQIEMKVNCATYVGGAH